MSEEKVRELAYLKWEAAGYPQGNGVDFWLQAEKELKTEKTKNPSLKVAAKATVARKK